MNVAIGKHAIVSGIFDIPYDGGAIGSVEGFGSMGAPDYSISGLTIGGENDPLNKITANTGSYVVPEDGYLNYRIVGRKTPEIDPWIKINGFSAAGGWIPESVAYSRGGQLTVKKGDIVTWNVYLNTGLANWLFFIPQKRNKGSISTAVYMTY